MLSILDYLSSISLVVTMQIYWCNCIIVIAVLCVVTSLLRKSNQPAIAWDSLTFTQSWPNTVCIKTVLSGSSQICRFSKPRGVWSIHGVWPTKLGRKGPSFCNSSLPFINSHLAPIEEKLSDYWVNILSPRERSSFLRYEWNKYGTCAAMLPQLNTEVKYFKKALQWIQIYNMRDILTQSEIYPSDLVVYKFNYIWTTVTNILGKMPIFVCYYDQDRGFAFLSEIQICFDKSLKLTDCYNGPRNDDNITNCPLEKDIVFPTIVKVLRYQRLKNKAIQSCKN